MPTWNSFKHRRPGVLWVPQHKPRGPIELNPQGPLSPGLVSLLLFDNNLNGGVTRDYAAVGQVTSNQGSSGLGTIVTTSPFGGVAVNTNGTSTTDFIGYVNAGPSLAQWSLSALMKFDGIGGGTYTGNLVLAANSGLTLGIGVNNGTNQFTNFANEFTAPVVTSLSTWHRVTFTQDGATQTFYLDGISQATLSASSTIQFADLIFGWPWPTVDFFLWNYCLQAPQVLGHFQDPYGQTLRPRFSELGLVPNSNIVSPGVGARAVTGFAPTVQLGTTVTPGVGARTITGLAPTILTGNVISPGVGSRTITGFAPTIINGGTVPITVSPRVGARKITGFAPTIAGTKPLGGAPDDYSDSPIWWDTPTAAERKEAEDKILEDMRIEIGLLPPRVAKVAKAKAKKAVDAAVKVIEEDNRTEEQAVKVFEKYESAYAAAYAAAFSQAMMQDAQKLDMEEAFRREVRQKLLKPRHFIDKDDEQVMSLIRNLLG